MKKFQKALNEHDKVLLDKSENGLIKPHFPRDWRNLMDRANSQELKDHFRNKMNESAEPLATWPGRKHG